TPATVIRSLLEMSRKRGLVLDPFAGAGTVGLVARAMGRDFVGVERDPKMATLAARRLRIRRRPRPAGAVVRAGVRSARRSGRPA
ncbi:MAG TPA: DNA methyltransferase, partial [Candidatus Binatia bacterium]|nr:DNA methyltransferase [Candidatus Binatia bacterium]